MKCSNPGCNRGIGLVAYRRGWLNKQGYCSRHCRDLFVADAANLQGCDRNLAEASASVAAMQARIKSLSGTDKSEICNATRLYFFEVVKARAVTALCKSGAERERDLGRFDTDVAHANDAIAARCL